MTATPMIDELTARLRAARAAHPSLIRQWIKNPVLYQQACAEARQRAQLLPPRLFEDHSRDDGFDSNQVEDEGPIETVEPVKRRQRRMTLPRVKRDADKAGISVAAYDVKPDGTISIIVGKPTLTTTGDNDDDAPDRSDWH